MNNFSNPKNTGSHFADSRNWGPNQEYYGGLNTADGLGHGHRNPNNGFDRPPVSNFLGNIATRGAGVELHNQANTPKW